MTKTDHRIAMTLRLPDGPTRAYLAGLLDGEGSISISRGRDGRYHALRVDVTSSSTVLIAWLLTFGGKAHPKAKSALSKRPVFSWMVHGKDAETLLRAVEPYMVVKREQAKVGIAFQEITRRPRRERLAQDVIESREAVRTQMRVLNGKVG